VRWNGGSQTFAADKAGAAITGLTNGTTYRFTVTARNVLGDSTASAQSAAAIPYGKPGPPGNPHFADTAPNDGSGRMTLIWGASDPNGRPVSTYHFVVTGGAASPQSGDVSGSTTSVTVTGHVGSTYSFSVYATGPGGQGTTVASSNKSSPKPSSPPTVNATGSGNGSGDVKVTWGGVNSTESVTYTIDVEGGPQNVTRTGSGSATFTSSIKSGTVTVKVSAVSAGISAGSATDTASNSKPTPSGSITSKGARTRCSDGTNNCQPANFTVHNIPTGDYSVTLTGYLGDTSTSTIHMTDGGSYQTSGAYGIVPASSTVTVRITGPKNFNISVSGTTWNNI